MRTEPNINGIQAGLRLNTIVYMGAGGCSDLDALLALQPQRLLLIEADPQLAAALQARTAMLKQIQVQNAAVSGRPGQAILYRYNLPHAGSLHPASGLLELYPGLKVVEQLQVEAKSPVALLQPLGLSSEQENLLIVDVPGEEFQVLQALQNAGQLHLFGQLLLHCGRQPLYVDSKPAAQILHWLQNQGFDVLTEDDTQNQDRPRWALQRNDLYLRNRELERKLQLANQAKAQMEERAAELQSRILQLTHERDEHAKWHMENKKWAEGLKGEKAQLEQQVAQLVDARDEQTKLANERQTLIQQLTNERDEHARWHMENKKWAEGLKAEKTQLEQRFTQMMDARDEQTRLAGERQTTIQQLIQEREEKARQLAESSAAFKGTISELKTELTQARQTATLSTKLYALREADLVDLQSRYKEAVNMQERQHLLMLQLEEKLRVAAQYFHQLHNNAISPMAVAAESNSAAKRKPRLIRAKQKARKPGKA